MPLVLNDPCSCRTVLFALYIYTGTYGSIGMTYGGPVVMVWGWLVVCLFTTR